MNQNTDPTRVERTWWIFDRGYFDAPEDYVQKVGEALGRDRREALLRFLDRQPYSPQQLRFAQLDAGVVLPTHPMRYAVTRAEPPACPPPAARDFWDASAEQLRREAQRADLHVTRLLRGSLADEPQGTTVVRPRNLSHPVPYRDRAPFPGLSVD